MNKAHLIFTKHAHSFSVHVENLEKLSVEQIQSIEAFVKARNGVFDFETYTFAIQKKLEFDEFVSVIENSNISSTCEEKKLKVQQKAKVEFGKYKGMYYSELPDAYLLWLKSNYRGKDRDIVDAELNFRTI
ncbi:MAG: DUF3820 family protein [Sulfurimonas sp.]|nr:DUF3820 family protein [Sulfurimonas sp.]MCK4974925.1 DUF3820 family protein [Sulfurimonas sp.]